MAELTENKIYSFSGFELDPERRILRRDGEAVSLNSKAFELLLFLVEHRGEVLSKDALLEKVWAGQFVEENNLTVHISALRKALGERKNENRFIVTIPGRGYSFVHALDEPEKPESEIVVENRSFSRIVIEETEPDFAKNNQSEKNAQAVPQLEKASTAKKAGFKNPTILFWGGSAVFVLFLAFLYWSGNSFFPQRRVGNFSNLKLNRLTASGKILNAAVSPDAKFMIFAQKEDEGQSLWLRQIETGSQKQIVESKQLDYLGLSITPDGNYLYATAFEANNADPVVRKIPVLGGAAQQLPFWTCVAVSFSPDGKQIAFNQPRSVFNETHLITANADGTDLKILKRLPQSAGSFPNYKTNSVAWSPDGGEIATIIEETGEEGNTARLVSFNPNDGSEKSLSEKRWAFVWHLAWTADGENLAIAGQEKGATASQIWLVSRATGEARRITNDLHDYGFIFAAKNSPAIFAVQKNVTSALQVADFDENKEVLEPRAILTQTDEFDNVRWTAAGDILYTSTSTGKNEIWRIRADGANQTPLTVDSGVAFGMSASPDGQKIAFHASRDNRMSIWIADSDGKNPRPLNTGQEDINPKFAGNDQIVFQRGLNNKNITLWRVGLNGEPPVQLTHEHSTHPAASHDGERVAYYFMDRENSKESVWRIGLISTATGAFEGKLSFPKFVTERRMAWHPNGRFIAQIFYAGDNANLLLLPVGGDAAKTYTNLGKGEIGSFDWSRDGRSIAYSRHTESRDIVSLQNLP